MSEDRLLRGCVAIYPAEGDAFDLYDWSEGGDSGYCIGRFASRSAAVNKARAWAAEHHRRLPQAEVVDLARFRGSLPDGAA